MEAVLVISAASHALNSSLIDILTFEIYTTVRGNSTEGVSDKTISTGFNQNLNEKQNTACG